MINLTELFCKIDDFCGAYEKYLKQRLIESGEKKRNRTTKLSTSEMMTIVVLFHHMGFRNFKTFYLDYVCIHLRKEFPQLISYDRFVALTPTILPFLSMYLMVNRGKATGISYMDSTPIAVCHNMRINRNKVFAGLARRGKSSTGWFYGFKLHLVINEHGELLNFCLTAGNVNDRKPVTKMVKLLTGKLFGDRGYISQELFSQLLEQGLQLITTVRKNMKNKFMPLMDKILLRKRFIIETVNDQLKNISQIEHSRHRSVLNFMVNLVAGLVAYIHQPKKPSIKFNCNNFAGKMLVC